MIARSFAAAMVGFIVLFLSPRYSSAQNAPSAGSSEQARPIQEKSQSEVLVQAATSVVLVQTPAGFGSGFVVASTPSNSLIVTTAHVLGCDPRGSYCVNSARILLPNSKQAPLAATIVQHGRANLAEDVALLSVPVGNVPALHLAAGAASDYSALGRRATVIGYTAATFAFAAPGGTVTPSLSFGAISEVLSGGSLIRIDVVPPGLGSTGGPVIDESGTVIGMLYGVIGSSPIAISASALSAELHAFPAFPR